MGKELSIACKNDLGRREDLTFVLELGAVVTDINHTISHLKEWASEKMVDGPMFIGPARQKIVYEPLGVVLIMGSWNFPYFTTLLPLIPVIAAGNTCVIKPSEMSPNCSRKIKQLICRYLDMNAYVCIEGAVEVAKTLTTKLFDYIVFTGGSEKGKLVA